MKRSVRNIVDLMIMAAIFLIVAIHLWGNSMQDLGNPAEFVHKGDYYLVYWYPLQNCMIEMVFAVFLLAKAIRFNSCLYTKVCTWMYLALSTLSLLDIIFIFDYEIYITLINLILNLATLGIITTFALKCLLTRQSTT